MFFRRNCVAGPTFALAGCLAVSAHAASTIVTGAGPGAGPHVKEFDGQTLAEIRSFFPYTPSFTGGVRVATGDVNGDRVPDIITGPGSSVGPHVQAFSGQDTSLLRSFFAYNPAFTGGVFVGAGDVNDDGLADLVTGADAGGGPHVKVFNAADSSELHSFFAFEPTFTGGVRVAAGDLNGDGHADLIAGSGPGRDAEVRIFDGLTEQPLGQFMAYGASFRGGIFVAAGDINGDNIADIVTGPDEGSALDVKVFDGATLLELTSYSAFGSGFQGGVRVAVGDIDGDGRNDVITGAGPGGAPHVKVFDGQTDDLLRSFFAYDQNFTGGVYVASVPIPEPATLTLVALGFASLARRRDRGASLTSACGRRAA